MIKLAYLTSRYPAISHTFVMREIMALRACGLEVATFSQRTAGDEQILAEADREERAATYYILPPRWGRILAAHVLTLVRRPLRYLATLAFAWRVRPGGLKAALWHLFYFVEAVLLWHALRQRGIGHVHVHFAGPCATLAMIARRLGDLTYSLTVHGSAVFFDVEKNLLCHKVEGAALVLCISDFTRAQVMAHADPQHWDKLKVVHCGIDARAYPPKAADAEAPAHILCVARLLPAKGLSDLLDAVATLRRAHPRIRCTLVGDGPDRARLEARCLELGLTDAVHFAGFVGQDAIQPYYEAADVFVLPSYAEGVPVVLMEALAKGVPAIATAVGGTSELIEHGVTGLLVPPGRPDRLADALDAALHNGALRARLIEHGRAKVLEEFEMTAIGRQVAEHFAALLGAPAPGAGRRSAGA